MSRVKQTTREEDTGAAGEPVRTAPPTRHVCPYCGQQYAGGPEACPRCTMEDSPATRQATKARIGPWYVLQSRNPAAPGMKYATLLALINKGHVSPRSIVRGPTTHQLWRYAAHVRGVSREFGLCYSCGGAIDRASSVCSHCQRSQEPPAEPDVLLETRANGSAAADPTSAEAASYASRLRDLQRRQAAGQKQSRESGTAPSRSRNELPRLGDGRIVSAMELAAALRDDPSRALHAPRSLFFKFCATLFVLVLLAGAAGAGVLWLKPQYRQPAYDWVHTRWAMIRERASAIEWPSFGDAGSGTTAQPSRGPAPSPATRPVVAAHEPPRPAVQVAGEPQRPAAPRQHEARQPVHVAIEPPAQAPAPAITLEQAIVQARALWPKALEAESRRDYATAVRLFQEIQKLPADAWPGGLQWRLDDALKRAGQSSVE